MRIGELAARCGANARTIRYYEARRLASSSRWGSGRSRPRCGRSGSRRSSRSRFQ
ncbi:MAG: MerR family DNA-binding transcriptional regulator [Armatimonadota bacterium]|nr:MerR family DNA-binding transcriptional regulator [Armatimonadota bacterium]MDR5696126.1 MerR family DNA-binding transcriptional regulator [Armatimonadota bacterium]